MKTSPTLPRVIQRLMITIGIAAGLFGLVLILNIPPTARAYRITEPETPAIMNDQPDLWIRKSAVGQASPGLNYLYRIDYGNKGPIAATGVRITDTLPNGMTYLADTCATAPTVAGNQLVWDITGVAPGTDTGFNLYVAVDEGVSTGATLTNTVEIQETEIDENPLDNFDERATLLVENDASVYPATWAWTDDPATDNDYIYTVEVCNSGATASGEIVVTDTLPGAVTLVTWWSDHPGWNQVVKTGDQLALKQMSLPGGICKDFQVHARVAPTATPGTPLLQKVNIAAVGDLHPADNAVEFDHEVGYPRENLEVDLEFSNGVIVPNGQLTYQARWSNTGNTTAAEPVVLTNEMPDGANFAAATLYTNNGLVDFPPTQIVGNQVIWETPELAPGFSHVVEIQLLLTAALTPGHMLTNTFTINNLADEEFYSDNAASWVETLNPAGPNLRLRQDHYWRGGGALSYHVYLENVGSEGVSPLVITNTYPLSVTLTDVTVNFWESVTVTTNITDHQVYLAAPYLDPGQELDYAVTVALEHPGERMHWYTNTSTVTTPPTDPTPDDNSTVEATFSGGEVNFINLLWGPHRAYIHGEAMNNVPVVVATPYTEVQTLSDAFGNWTAGDIGYLAPGDTLTITGDQGQLPVIIRLPDPFDIQANSDNNTVMGTIGEAVYLPLEIDLYDRQMVWRETDDQGFFAASFWDFPRGNAGEIRLWAEIDHAIVGLSRPFRPQDLILAFNFDDQELRGDYDVGHTAMITLTNADQTTVKATALISTAIDEGRYWDGFKLTAANWSPAWPTFEATDRIFAQTDDGETTSVRLGTITGAIDVVADTVVGAVAAPWLPQYDAVGVRCFPISDSYPCAPHKEDSVLPDGLDAYFCSWNPQSEWDIQAGEGVAVEYLDNNHNSVIYDFVTTGIDLDVSKTATPTIAVPGRPLTYTIIATKTEVLQATGVVVTDTLPLNVDLTHFMTSHGTCTHGAHKLICDVGTLTASETQVVITLTTMVNGQATGSLLNTVAIRGNEPDPYLDNNQHYLISTITPVADLALTKTASPNAVAIGEEITFTLHIVNNGPDLAAEAVVTDYVPSNMTFVRVTTPYGECDPPNAWTNAVICALDPLDATASSATIDIVLIPNQAGMVINTAHIAGIEFDPNPGNNAGSAGIYVTEEPVTAPRIQTVTPGTGLNTTPVTLTIEGSNFDPEAVVMLGTTALSNVVFVSSQLLEAAVPAGLPVGTYAIKVINPDTQYGILLDAYTAYTASPPVIYLVNPRQGPNDQPVIIDIYGSNFASEMTVALTQGRSNVPLNAALFINSNRLRAVVPPNIAVGLYGLAVTNPNAMTGVLEGAYRAVAPNETDLYAHPADLWVNPPNPREGAAPPTLGLNVRRQGGAGNVATVVDFYDGPPETGTLIGRTGPVIIPPNGSVTATVAWSPAPDQGRYTVYAVIDPEDAAPESNETNNVISYTLGVLPPRPDTLAPTIDDFQANNDTQVTNQRQVFLDLTAHDNTGGTGVKYVLYVEYEYIQSAYSWVPVASSGWLPFADAGAEYPWLLRPGPGVHYLKAWVADGAGNLSTAARTFINYLPAQSYVAPEQVAMFRFWLTAGLDVSARLTSLSGDADIYAWAPDGTRLAFSDTSDLVEVVTFTASVDGIYQIEVYGHEAALYRLELQAETETALTGDQAPATSIRRRGRGNPLADPNEEPNEPIAVPEVPLSGTLVYLPIVIRQN
ncbi:MAG: DUF11 domain-containing protein [Anaerolineae bacterium]|nr:DUF11 domain-containing protein [Anaerolineae bacterium]